MFHVRSCCLAERQQVRKETTMIKIVCDRCKQEISGKPRYIAFGVKDSTEEKIEVFGEGDYCENCIDEIKTFIIRGPAPVLEPPTADPTALDLLAAGQTTTKKPGKRNTHIDMGKVNALREAGWSIGKIAEEMHIPTEELAEKIFDRKVQEQKTAKV